MVMGLFRTQLKDCIWEWTIERVCSGSSSTSTKSKMGIMLYHQKKMKQQGAPPCNNSNDNDVFDPTQFSLCYNRQPLSLTYNPESDWERWRWGVLILFCTIPTWCLLRISPHWADGTLFISRPCFYGPRVGLSPNHIKEMRRRRSSIFEWMPRMMFSTAASSRGGAWSWTHALPARTCPRVSRHCLTRCGKWRWVAIAPDPSIRTIPWKWRPRMSSHSQPFCWYSKVVLLNKNAISMTRSHRENVPKKPK